jgi:hypothetical protein
VRAVSDAVTRARATGAQLFVGKSVHPFVDYLAPQAEYVILTEERGLPLSRPERGVFVAEANRLAEPSDRLFTRNRGRLWYITRHYYYDVLVRDIRVWPEFDDAWGPPRRDGHAEHRMLTRPQGRIVLPPRARGEAKLTFALARSGPPGTTVEVSLNGRILDRIVEAGRIEREYTVEASGSDRLQFTIVPPPAAESLRLESLTWGSSAPRRQGP